MAAKVVGSPAPTPKSKLFIALAAGSDAASPTATPSKGKMFGVTHVPCRGIALPYCSSSVGVIRVHSWRRATSGSTFVARRAGK
jgi:hypothetical protein